MVRANCLTRALTRSAAVHDFAVELRLSGSGHSSTPAPSREWSPAAALLTDWNRYTASLRVASPGAPLSLAAHLVHINAPRRKGAKRIANLMAVLPTLIQRLPLAVLSSFSSIDHVSSLVSAIDRNSGFTAIRAAPASHWNNLP